MSKIVRYVFMGNVFAFFLLCITVIGIPIAFSYLLQQTIRIEEDVQYPQRFVEQFKG